MRLRARVWAALAALAACKSTAPTRVPAWSSDGGAFGERVRAGELKGVRHVRFASKILGREVGVVVATPPGYEADADRRYPVVYVFPGLGGDEWTYARDVGMESAAIKALWADPQRAPIVVFPNPGDSGGYDQAGKVLSEELVSFVDETFRTQRSVHGRSLEGCSLGGVTALTLLLERPDLFGRAVGFSSACYLISSCGELRSGLVKLAKRRPAPSVLLAIGEREPANNRAISEELSGLLGVKMEVVPRVEHDWAAQLAQLGPRVAEFHLAGFAAQ